MISEVIRSKIVHIPDRFVVAEFTPDQFFEEFVMMDEYCFKIWITGDNVTVIVSDSSMAYICRDFMKHYDIDEVVIEQDPLVEYAVSKKL